MRPFLRIVVLFHLLALSACHSEIKEKMDISESFLRQRPDSALFILKSINPLSLHSRKDLARYSLLMSAALDKNFIDITSDTLISSAVEYYSRHNYPRYRMLAYYYQGIIQKNSHSFSDAIVSLERAEAIASALGDDLYLGLINRNKANVFNATNNTQEALNSMHKAVSFFTKAEAVNYKAYAELSLAIDYLNSQHYEKSDSLLAYIKTEYTDSNLIQYCNLYHADILAITESDPVEAVSLFQNVPKTYFSILNYADYALAHEKIGNRDSADYWFAKGYSACLNGADSAALDYSKSKLSFLRGDSDLAFHLVTRAVSVQDSLTRTLLQQSISCSQRDYYKNEAALQKEQMKSTRQTVSLVGVICLLLALFTLASFIVASRKKDQLLKEQMTQLFFSKKEIDRLSKEKAHLLGALFSGRINHLDSLTEKYFQMDNLKEKGVVFNEIKETVQSLRNNPEAFSSLEKDLDRYCNSIMTKLRSQVPRIKNENLKLISLFFAGIPDSTIQILLNKVSVDSLRMARSRFRKVIIASGAPDTDFFLEMLNKKKRPQEETTESYNTDV